MLQPVLRDPLVGEADTSSGPAASLRAYTPPATLPLEDPSVSAGEGEVPAWWGITERALFLHRAAK